MGLKKLLFHVHVQCAENTSKHTMVKMTLVS